VGGYAPRGQEDSMRPRRLSSASGRPLNFTVRRELVSLRIGGIVIMLLGIAVAAAGVVGTTRGPSMAAFAEALARSRASSALDSSTWLHHWRISWCHVCQGSSQQQ
jgi:hypothetical protein